MVPDRASRESLKEIDIKKYHYIVHHILLLHFNVHHHVCQLILFTETIDESFQRKRQTTIQEEGDFFARLADHKIVPD